MGWHKGVICLFFGREGEIANENGRESVIEEKRRDGVITKKTGVMA